MKKNEIRVGSQYLVSRSLKWDEQRWADIARGTVLDSEAWHKQWTPEGADDKSLLYAGETITLPAYFARGWSRHDFSGILCKVEWMDAEGDIYHTEYDIIHLRYLRAPWGSGWTRREKNLLEAARRRAEEKAARDALANSIQESLQYLSTLGIAIPYVGGQRVELTAAELSMLVQALRLRATA